MNSSSSPPVRDSTGSPRSRIGPSSTNVMGTAADDDYSASNSPTKENDSPFDSDIKRTSLTLTSPATSAPPTRSPLSWQRRPPSQASERPKSRPLSVVAAENAAARSNPASSEPTSAAEQTPSRDQIAQTLAGKDPAFFRQTADRGQSSAAYRRNQVEDPDTMDLSTTRAQLPGMETPKEKFPESPLNLSSAQRLEPPTGEDENALPGSQSVTSPGGRTSPTRARSPTKGMGGFVQSAMMKRSDSVKRWSVTSPIGLQRADSSVANRNSLEQSQRTGPSRPGSRLGGPNRDGSTTPTSRPTSSHEKESETRTEPQEDADKPSPPTSPSKTMDPRRWSPTKSSSWLEAALNKPESPKPMAAPPPPNQPAWMVELNKAKAQKATSGSVDLGRAPTTARKHEVKTGGLMRSTPMGSAAQQSSFKGFRGASSAAGDAPASTATASPASVRSSLTKANRPDQETPGTDDAARRPSVSGAPRTKPETPPKKDFRTSLKARTPVPDSDGAGGQQGDELKSVFGNLRRTKTQNFVAPDELKGNILRGKAALNVTGGPKKTDRVDEFKDAILKKKDDFQKAQQDGRGIVRTAPSNTDAPVPEGLAKRMEMNRTGTISRRDSATPNVPSESAGKPVELSRSSALPTNSERESVGLISLSTPKAKSSPALVSAVKPEKEAPAAMPTLQRETSEPSRLQSKPSLGGGLANRFNPALAGMLARGPPGATSNASGASNSASTKTEEPSGPSPQLTHMTKNRARGPRRKAPTSTAPPSEEPVKPVVEQPAPVQPKPTPFIPSTPASQKMKAASPKPAVAPKPQPISIETKRTAEQVISLVDSARSNRDPVTKPAGQAINFGDATPKTRPRSPTKIHEQVAAMAAKAQQGAGPKDDVESQPSSPRKLDMKRMSRFLDEQSQASQASQATPKVEKIPSPTRSQPIEPTKRSTNDRVDSERGVLAKSVPAPLGGAGLGLSQVASRGQPSAAQSATSESPRPRSQSRGARPLPLTPKPGMSSPQISTPARSPTKYGAEVSDILNNFFGSERPERRYRADAAEILMYRPVAGARVSTQRVQLFQISGDGKKVPVPQHNERVLFEREMYLCPHAFTNESGKKVTEVYFWAGDEVPEATADDAHLFVQREARAVGGKLVKLRQGKETPEFLQALGGIVIIRRGSSNKYDSLAPNMLCGRRYLGQVVFDEVDFSPVSLCSGFPYLVTQQGKCFLWKGKGCNVDELSCARLIGMDLALMGELMEIEDGSEPSHFWDIFSGAASRLHSADHWRLKPNYDKYCGRLFYSNPADRKQVSLRRPCPLVLLFRLEMGHWRAMANHVTRSSRFPPSAKPICCPATSTSSMPSSRCTSSWGHGRSTSTRLSTTASTSRRSTPS